MPDEQPIPKAEGPHSGGSIPENPQVPVTQEAEIVNVLFIDLVGYTTLGTQKGSEVVEELFRLVRETTEFKKEQDRGRLRLLPSGDGTAIVFLRGSPAAPVRCALQIARAIKGNHEIKLRMGVNSGPIFWITDITGENVPAGGGINYAARAMSCGDDGHILLTQATAEVLLDLKGWDTCIQDIGEYEVKHGRVMHLYNLCQDDLGNPVVPPRNRVAEEAEKLPQPAKIAIETASVPAGTLGTPYKTALRAPNSTGAQTWTVQSGNLPPGIHLASATGMLAGTPTAAGDYTFTVQVTDSTSASAKATFALAIIRTLSILTTSAPSATVGTAYKVALQANSTDALAWTVHSGELPPGMQLEISSGELTGTPTAAGNYTFTVQATDSIAAPTRATLTLLVAKKQPRFRIPKYVLYGGVAASLIGLVALWGWLSPPVVEAQLHLQPLDPGAGSPVTSPQLSADGTHLVFSRKDSEGKSDIYLADFDHGVLTNANRNITGQNTSNDCVEPALSPDGKNLVLVLERRPPSSQEAAKQRPHDGTSGLYLIDLEQPALLHTLPTKGYNPIWSPEGRRIVFGTENIGRPEDRDSILNQLLSVDAATLGKTAFASAPNAYRGDAVQPSWSPHATRLAIWFTRNGHRDIGTLRADGTDFVPITDDAHLDWNPVWSPDGYIYFSSDRGGNGLRLWRVRVNEDSGKVIGRPAEVHGSPLDPESISFSRDGRNMILLARQFTSDLYKAPFDAETGTVGQPVLVMNQGEATRPNISPDGGSVLYNSLRAKASDSISVFSFEKAENTTVWSDGNMNRSPRWSPDGNEIAFWSNRNGGTQVWIMPANGSGRPVQISPTGGTDNFIYPVWGPSGRELVFTRLGDSVSDSQTFIYNRDTGQAIGLPGTESFVAWSWSPDGDSLAGYMQRRDGASGIAIYSLKDKKLVALTNFGSDPVWCGDPHKNNLRILFFYKGEIFLVNAAQGYATTKVLSAESLKENVEVAPHGFSLSNDQRFLYFSRQVTRTQLYYATIENGYGSLM